MSALSKPVGDVAETDVVQLCMTGTLFHQLVDQLTARGLTINPFTKDDDELDTYIVGVSQRLWDSIR